jgi:hypothetical protein
LENKMLVLTMQFSRSGKELDHGLGGLLVR